MIFIDLMLFASKGAFLIKLKRNVNVILKFNEC